ncbi:MAG TPA: thioredoxin family protein [Thermoanaerobaculia bacterium]|nr:thioredoxin family protein [Thermoanaerobaculia bacterium]
MKSVILLMLLSSLAAGAVVCAADPPPLTVKTPAVEAQEPAKKEEEAVLVGPATREKIEGAAAEWVQAEVEAHPDADAAQALASVAPGAEVTIFLGTWCGDSRREVPRFWHALDEVGGAVPFKVTYVTVDREKKEPAEAVSANGIRYLPTFIVRRDGREVGRIVETAPHGIEHDLLALLTGKAAGVIATRQDLTPPGGAKPQAQHP